MKRIIRTILLICQMAVVLGMSQPAFANSVYHAGSTSELEDVIYQALQNRDTSFKVEFTGDSTQIMDTIRIARDAAVAKDPYLEGSIALISGFKVSQGEGQAEISFDQFIYFTTKEQEQWVTAEINRLTAQLIKPSMDEATKVKVISDYVLKKVDYDESLAGYTAYSALKEGRTVCNGYVQLAYRLFEAAELESQIVKGKHKQGNTSSDHAWNLVKIDSKWYHLDLTLNDTLATNAYYLLTDGQIQADHAFNQQQYPEANTEWQQGKSSHGSSGGGTAGGQDEVEEPVAELPPTFSDLENHWARSEIEALARQAIVKGKTASTFDPQGQITRAEFAALLVRAFDLPAASSEPTFTDVEGQWFAASVAAAKKAGFINGYADGTFAPNASINRQEMAVMVLRALAFAGATNQVDHYPALTFKDSTTIAGWAREAVATGVGLGILQGDEQGLYNPRANATRAEAAVMLSRLLQQR